MKKRLLVGLLIVGIFTGTTKITYAANDETVKRKLMAKQTVVLCKQYVDTLNALKAMSDERGKLIVNFQDSDFSAADGITHASSATIGVLFDFVVPSLDANFQDAGNGGRNKQTLLQMLGQ